jgi:hypothetical protein
MKEDKEILKGWRLVVNIPDYTNGVREWKQIKYSYSDLLRMQKHKIKL